MRLRSLQKNPVATCTPKFEFRGSLKLLLPGTCKLVIDLEVLALFWHCCDSNSSVSTLSMKSVPQKRRGFWILIWLAPVATSCPSFLPPIILDCSWFGLEERIKVPCCDSGVFGSEGTKELSMSPRSSCKRSGACWFLVFLKFHFCNKFRHNYWQT